MLTDVESRLWQLAITLQADVSETSKQKASYSFVFLCFLCKQFWLQTDLLGIHAFSRLYFFFSFGAFNCLALHIKNGCADLKSQFLHRFIVFGISCISYLQRQLEEHVIQHKCQAVPNPSSLYPSQRELLDYIYAYIGSARKAGVEPCLLITVSLFSALKYINK